MDNNDVKGIRQIIPLNYMEYQRLMSKPYKEPLKYQAWKLFTSTESDSFNGDRIAEVILTSTDKKSNYDKIYKIRYIKFPKPIILSDFSDAFGKGISINGYNGSEEFYSNSVSGDPAETTTIWDPCELDPVIHEEILQRAIELAKVAW